MATFFCPTEMFIIVEDENHENSYLSNTTNCFNDTRDEATTTTYLD
jgi:hypothetical protein